MSELPSRADCVIIGGGAVGCSLAYHLARDGLRPLLLDAGQLGAGSTGRCAGGVRQQFSTEINVRVGMLSIRLLERFPEEIGSSADLRQIGYLFIGTSAAEREIFERNVAMQRRVGLKGVRLLEPHDIAELVPELRVDDVVAGTWCPSDGLAGPNEVTHGYAGAARRHGATIVEDCRVTGIDTTGGRVGTVQTQQGSVSTPMVVNCAGPHAATVGELAGVHVPVRPFRRHIFTTEPFALDPAPPMTVDFRTSFYFHPEGEGLLLGMSDPDEPESFDTTVDWNFLEHLVEHATHRLPALERAGIATGWAGLYEVSPDNQAIVGESELPGFWLCCGFSGHGFMQAPAIGLLLAQRMLGTEPELDLSAYSPQRFAGDDLHPEAAVI